MEHDAARLFAASIVLLIFDVAMVSVRLYTRWDSGRRADTPVSNSGLGIDDWLILLAVCLATFGSILLCVATADFALGDSASKQTPWNLRQTLFLIWMDQIAYFFVAMLTKLSTLLLYIRLVGVSREKRGFRRACWGVGLFLILMTIIMVIAVIFACSPPTYFYTRPMDLLNGDTAGSCRNQQAYWYFTVALSIGSDLVVMFLPWKIVWGMQMTWKKKWTVLGLYGLGGLVTLASIARGLTVKDAVTPGPHQMSSGIANLCLWSLIESHGGIICACIPTLAGPVGRIWKARIGPAVVRFFHSFIGDPDPYNPEIYRLFGITPTPSVEAVWAERGRQNEPSGQDDLGGQNGYSRDNNTGRQSAMTQLSDSTARSDMSKSQDRFNGITASWERTPGKTSSNTRNNEMSMLGPPAYGPPPADPGHIRRSRSETASVERKLVNREDIVMTHFDVPAYAQRETERRQVMSAASTSRSAPATPGHGLRGQQQMYRPAYN